MTTPLSQTQLRRLLSEKTGLSQVAINGLFATLVEVVQGECLAGNPVKIADLCQFELVHRGERKTPLGVTIPAHQRLKVRLMGASKTWRP